MHYIRQFFEGKPDEWVHGLFTRYGRGLFDGAACEVDVGKDIKFKGSVEYATFFASLVASCGGDFEVDGAIYAKKDFRDVLGGVGLEFDDKSKPKKGVFAVEISGELPSGVLNDVYSKIPYATALLNLTGEKGKFKCKKKPPKPGGERNIEFFSGSMELSALQKLREEVLFDVKDFKKVKVDNKYSIESIIIPPGMSAADARLNAKRKGRILRSVSADGVERKSECAFEA